MPDPIGMNLALQTAADAYRVFQQEMRNIHLKSGDLIRTIVSRVDAERLAEARKSLKENAYGS